MFSLSVLTRQMIADRRGLSSTELGIVLALIALGSVQALSSLGGEVRTDLDTASEEVAKNRVNADPFARGPGGVDPASENSSGGPGSDPPTAGDNAANDWDNGGNEPPVANSMPMNVQ